MDPASALGVASAAITFIDFGFKLTRGTFEVYKSATGSTESNTNIKAITQDLRNFTADLNNDFVGSTEHEKAIRDIAAKCCTLSDKLLKILQRLTVSEKSWRKSLKAKFHGMIKQDEIDDLQAELDRYRSHLLMHLDLVLR